MCPKRSAHRSVQLANEEGTRKDFKVKEILYSAGRLRFGAQLEVPRGVALTEDYKKSGNWKQVTLVTSRGSSPEDALAKLRERAAYIRWSVK